MPTEEMFLYGTDFDADGGCAPLPWERCAPRLEPGRPRHLRDVRPSSEGIDISADFSACEREMIELMWGVLRENADLIRWAACMSGADRSETACLMATFTETAPEVIAFTRKPDGCEWGFRFNRVGPADTPRITFCASSGSPWATAVELYCTCSAASATECAILSMCVNLLHEVSHVCGMKHSGLPYNMDGVPKRCQEVFLNQQAFAWALFQRYPDAASSACCAAWATTVPGSGQAIGQLHTQCTCHIVPLFDEVPRDRLDPAVRLLFDAHQRQDHA